MKPKFILILFLTSLFLADLRATEPGSVYVKNTGKTNLHIWVNGSYQGYLSPGETRYSVSDGFITNESARATGDGGRTPTKESHAGWENDGSGSVKLTFQYTGEEKQSYSGTPDDQGNVVYGVNEMNSKSPPVLPDELEIENASAVRKGSKPSLKSAGPKAPDDNRNNRTDQPKEKGKSMAGSWNLGREGFTLKPDGTARRNGEFPATGTWTSSGTQLTITVSGITHPVGQVETIQATVSSDGKTAVGKSVFSGPGSGDDGDSYDANGTKWSDD